MPAVHSTINARKRKKDNGLFPTSIIDDLLDILLMLLIMHLGEPLFDDEAHEKPDKAEEKCRENRIIPFSIQSGGLIDPQKALFALLDNEMSNINTK